MESCSYLLSWDLLLATVLALQRKLLADFIMGLKHKVKDDITLCPFMETQQAAAPLQIIFVSHLDVFKVEGHFAVFAVERSRLTFSLIVSVLLSAKDRGLAGLALDPLKLTAALMLSLNTEDRPVVMAPSERAFTCSPDVFIYRLSRMPQNDSWTLWCYLSYVIDWWLIDSLLKPVIVLSL